MINRRARQNYRDKKQRYMENLQAKNLPDGAENKVLKDMLDNLQEMSLLKMDNECFYLPDHSERYYE